MDLDDYLRRIEELKLKLYKKEMIREAIGHYQKVDDYDPYSLTGAVEVERWVEDYPAAYDYVIDKGVERSLEEIAMNAPYLKARKKAEEALGYHSSSCSVVLVSIVGGALLGALAGGLVFYYFFELIKNK